MLPRSVDWAAVRCEFPALENWTYLNTATYGLLPRRATAAVAQHFAHRDELACWDFLDWFDDATRLRTKIGQLIGCGPEDIAFVPNGRRSVCCWAVWSGILATASSRWSTNFPTIFTLPD